MKSKRNTEQALYRDLLAAADEEVSARETPATDERLQKVWQYWHELPSKWSPNEKAAFLLDSDLPELLRKQQSSTTRPCSDFHPQLSDFRRLTAKGLRLPLGPEFQKSVEAAARWTCLQEFLASTRTKHHEAIKKAWTWEDPLSQAMHRLAVVRAADELNISDPKILQSKNPTLSEIELLEARIDAYRDARLHALTRVRELVLNLIPKAKALPRRRRAPPAWTARNDVEKCYAIAALKALNVCSKEAWDHCLRREVPRLSSNHRRRFDAIHTDDHVLRIGSTLPLRTWLIDNGPLIVRFDLKKDAIFGRAGELGLSESQNVSDTSKWDLGFRFRRGQPNHDFDRIQTRLLSLLSPRPRFAVGVE